ncbi:MAG: DUF4352 domain-containing protein [Clostridia bacterium]
MGISALILGVVSLSISLIPFCGIIGLLPAIVGLVMGILDIIKQKKQKESKSKGIIGTVLSSLAIIYIVLGIVIFSVASNLSVTNLEGELEKEIGKEFGKEYIKDKQINEFNNVKTYKVGEEININGATLKITKIDKKAEINNTKASNGKEYVIVYVNILNSSSDLITYSPHDFSMLNSQGQLQNITENIELLETEMLSNGKLIPKGSVSGAIVFEEPKDASNLELLFGNDIFTEECIKVKLE